MSDRPLNIAFLWHMHQPYYKDPFSGTFRLPWVRLHGTKDYLDMVKILEDFPTIHQTFNIVPSMIEQLIDYTENNATDKYLDLTLKAPADLTEPEMMFVIENFFLANWDNMIKPYPRYYELLSKRGFRFSRNDAPRIAKYFTHEDIRDLQVLFNLAWIDPMFKKEDDFLSDLERKGKDFTENEKKQLIEKQLGILRQIIPQYKKMGDSGQIELSVTPYYHPILPLLWDTDSARIGMPHVKLPKKRFSHPEDAKKQITMAIEYFEKMFLYRPKGMWPSEGSVSEDVVRAINSSGIKWIATDEEVLARSIDKPIRDNDGFLIDGPSLYRPHKYSDVSIFFRDHKMSDLIGFVYSGWDAKTAVDDFMSKLLQVKNSLPDDRPYVVPIILDGENAWEYYKNDGDDFLRTLYSSLSADHRFKTVTMSEYMNEHGPGESLHKLHAGSWINANFGIWLGHEEDNTAWDYLSQARDDLEAFIKENPEKDVSEAWKSLYAAEGSDWNWWYGDEHSTETQTDFDELFRFNLMKIYKSIGKDVPPELFVPILLEDRGIAPSVEVRGFIYPKMDGVVTSYFEWYQAAYIDAKKSGGSMHKSESFIKALYYGFNKDNLYIRVDPATAFSTIKDIIIVDINLIVNTPFKIICDLNAAQLKARISEKKSGQWMFKKEIASLAADEIFEIEIPFNDINAKEKDEISISVEISRNGDELERCPWRGHITLNVPSPHYETIMWY
ncbi:MAG: glycoside hydrolase [Nitrospirae bacterium]|nr:glycoside hydrolase [Nitrospirota bacterium]